MKALGLLIKPASGNCNMRCRYCFYADVTAARNVGNRGVMSLDTLETIVRGALAEAAHFCSFGFQGGEPTLAGLDFFRALIAFEKRHNANGVRIAHAIQTNGTLIDAEWAAFLGEHDFLTGVSIDAGREIHDDLRPGVDGRGTHKRAMKAAELLRLAGVQFNILSVVTGRMAAQPERVYRFYKEHDFRYIQFIPCLDDLKPDARPAPYSLDARSYGRFLCRIFDLWYEDYRRGAYYSIRAFDNYIHILAGQPPENCAMSGACSPYPLIEADGSVYPCDFYAIDRLYLGNVGERTFAEMLSGPAAERFAATSRQIDERCRVCAYFALCRGGCRRDREPETDGRLCLNKLCEAYLAFFKHALPRMSEISKTIVRQRPLYRRREERTDVPARD